MNFIKDHIEEYNSQPIVNSSTGFCLNSVVDRQDLIRPVLENEEFGGVWVSDASETQVVSYSILDPINEVTVKVLSDTEKQLSSASREFQAVENTIERLESQLRKNNPTVIYWMTDSQVVCRWSQRGTRIEAMRKRLVKLFRHCMV